MKTSSLLLILLVTLFSGVSADEHGLRRRTTKDIDEHDKHEEIDTMGMTMIEAEEIPLDLQIDRDLKEMGCDRGGADNQKMIFFGKNFGTCSTMDRCLRAAMPIQMAYYCPKYGRPSCGGQCVSLIKGDCSDGIIRDKEGGTHNFKTDDKFWRREVETWGFGLGRPFWPANFGQGSCAYDYSALFDPNAAVANEPKFTYKKEKMKTCAWLAKLSDEGILKICKTRFKLPAARVECPNTCKLNFAVSRANEANNKYLHRSKVRKSCRWLAARIDKLRVCRKNKNARGNCPSECQVNK